MGSSNPVGGRGLGRGRVTSALAVAVVVMAAAACEGDNLFSGDSPELLPRVTAINAPASAVAGEAISVRVDGIAPHGVDRILLSLQGAVSRDTVVEVTPVRSQVSQTISVLVPPILQDTMLTVRASVSDVLGNVSRGREERVVAYGPPNVTAVTGPTSVRAGDLVTVEAKVTGARRVSRVDFRISGAFTKDTSIVVSPAQRSITQSLTVQVPNVVQDTVLMMNVYALDESGFLSPPKPVEIPLSIDPPTLSIQVPNTAWAGDNVEVKVSATGLRQVAQIRVELRGAAVRDTSVAVDPKRTDFSQTIAVRLPGDITSSVLGVHVYAIDVGGVVSATRSDTVNIPLGLPVVEDILVPGGVFNGHTADVRVVAWGYRPLMKINVRFRSAVEGNQSFDVSPQRHDVVQDAFILVPENPKTEVLIVEAWATDVSGDASDIVTRVVPITIADTSSSSGAGVGASAWKPAIQTTIREVTSRLDALLGSRAAVEEALAVRRHRRAENLREATRSR